MARPASPPQSPGRGFSAFGVGDRDDQDLAVAHELEFVAKALDADVDVGSAPGSEVPAAVETDFLFADGNELSRSCISVALESYFSNSGRREDFICNAQ